MQAHHMRPKNDFKAVPGKCWPYLDLGKSGGEEGIRTPVTLSSQAVYQIQPFHRRIFGVNKFRAPDMVGRKPVRFLLQESTGFSILRIRKADNLRFAPQ